MVIEAPLTVDKIKTQILSKLEERNKNISSFKSDMFKNSSVKLKESRLIQSIKEQSKGSHKPEIGVVSEKSEEQELSKSHPFNMPSISEQSANGLYERMKELDKFI